MPVSEPWQERLMAERENLRDKIRTMQGFLAGDGAKALAVEDVELLMEQQTAMAVYLNVLDKRIARFAA